jgi:hypothetical protein
MSIDRKKVQRSRYRLGGPMELEFHDVRTPWVKTLYPLIIPKAHG